MRQAIVEYRAPEQILWSLLQRPGGRVVMLRPAKPSTPVRFRPWPPISPLIGAFLCLKSPLPCNLVLMRCSNINRRFNHITVHLVMTAKQMRLRYISSSYQDIRYTYRPAAAQTAAGNSKGKLRTDAFAQPRRCIMEIVVIISGMLVGGYLFMKLGGGDKD